MSVPESTPQVDSHDVVRWAESADGTRDKTVYLVQQQGRIVVMKEGEMSGDDRCIMTFLTPSRQPRRPSPTITLACGSKVINLDKYDAVFWTESSVEKFLWPYYHSHRIYDDEIAGYQDAFEKDQHIVAVAHTPLTHTATIGDQLMLAVRKDDGTPALLSLEQYRLLFKER